MYALADCNNFFASCERVFRPELNGRPVIVLSNNDGCAVARSNEAKALGIKMGDPYFKLKPLIEANNIAVFSSNFALYGDMSRRVQEVLRTYSPAVEPYSIDECFLDLSGMEGMDFDALAKRISRDCWKQTSIPVSVGIAPTKTLAKIASKLCKKYPKLRGGCYMYRPEDIEKVLRKFPAEDVWGIGRRSMRKLEGMGVQTAWDYTQLPETTVRTLFHLPGFRTWKELKGIPCIELEDMIEPKQTICVSRSFSHDVTSLQAFTEQITTFAGKAVEKLRAQHSHVGEMIVFAVTNRFKEYLPQTSGGHYVVFPEGTQDHRKVVVAAAEAARFLFREGYAYKKGGVVFTKIEQNRAHVSSLFEDSKALEKDERLSCSIDSINKVFGPGAVLFGVQGDGSFHMTQEHKSPRYTTRWTELPKVSVK
ncbi:MAG: Y-family DNA polymerase [Bacteroidales bacterium]|nr:Y-family DNA polymerase [Bacteroidales bacterium]